jgi:DNA modification methylase
VTARELLALPAWDLLDSPVIAGDCVEVMASLPAESVHAIVCDPPYGLEFMGKEWDRLGDARQPGDPTFTDTDNPYGRSKVRMGGTAAYRSSSSPRRQQAWHEAWAREALRVLKPGGHLLAFGGSRTFHRLAAGIEDAGFEVRDTIMWLYGSGFPKSRDIGKSIDAAAGATRQVIGQRTDGRYAHGFTEQAKKALGSVVAAENESGFSGQMGELTAPATPEAAEWEGWGTALKPSAEPIVVARKPMGSTVTANVLRHGTGALNIAGCRLAFRGEADEKESKGKNRHGDFGTKHGGNVGASRFMYVAKAGGAERDAGLADNDHPTVKPIDLMRWLVRLVTPPQGIVLDPFVGSGTTGCAASLEGIEFVGVEREEAFVQIARTRIAWWRRHPTGIDTAKAVQAGVKRDATEVSQMGLFG